MLCHHASPVRHPAVALAGEAPGRKPGGAWPGPGAIWDAKSSAVGLAALAVLAAGSLRQSRPSRGRALVCRPALQNWPRAFIPPVAKIDYVLKRVSWPEEWPYTEGDFRRGDEESDEEFYSEPRLVLHTDQGFVDALKQHYATEFAAYPDARILDVCSSWTSHYPEERSWSHVSITGMNRQELEKNEQADDFVVHNLNSDPTLPYGSESFDVVTCAVSFDYLTRPLDVMREVARVLKPGGLVILSTSNKCFPAKAVQIWLLNSGPMEHALIYGSYMHFTDEFEPPEARDLSSVKCRGMGIGDPVYVIQARKKGGGRAGDEEPSEEEEVEAIVGLNFWLESRGLLRHAEAVSAWSQDMGAVDFTEVAENTEDLAEFLGSRLTREERARLLRGTKRFSRGQ